MVGVGWEAVTVPLDENSSWHNNILDSSHPRSEMCALAFFQRHAMATEPGTPQRHGTAMADQTPMPSVCASPLNNRDHPVLT